VAGSVPVVVVVFNRPNVVRQLLTRLAEFRPKTLFVIGDGARPHKPGEAELVQAVREQFARISWPCEVVADYEAENLGCRRRVGFLARSRKRSFWRMTASPRRRS
jgi:hypothetical protein